MSSFGNFVKKLRNEAGLSQEKLADKMDVSVNTIQNWESGNTRINPDKFGSLAHILNVPKDELVREYCRDDDGSRSESGRRFYSMIRSIRLWKLFILI